MLILAAAYFLGTLEVGEMSEPRNRFYPSESKEEAWWTDCVSWS